MSLQEQLDLIMKKARRSLGAAERDFDARKDLDAAKDIIEAVTAYLKQEKLLGA